jgi:hypothetical protein
VHEASREGSSVGELPEMLKSLTNEEFSALKSHVLTLTSKDDYVIKEQDLSKILRKFPKIKNEKGVWDAIRYIFIDDHTVIRQSEPLLQGGSVLMETLTTVYVHEPDIESTLESALEFQIPDAGPDGALVLNEADPTTVQAAQAPPNGGGSVGVVPVGGVVGILGDVGCPGGGVNGEGCVVGGSFISPDAEAKTAVETKETSDNVKSSTNGSEEEDETNEDEEEAEDSEEEAMSLASLEKQEYGVYSKDLFKGFVRDVRHDELCLVPKISENQHKRLCTFGKDFKAESAFCLGIREKSTDGNQYKFFYYPMLPDDQGHVYDSESVYKLPKAFCGNVLVKINNECKMGKLLSFTLELNTTGKFIRYLYSVLDSQSGNVLKVDESCFCPVFTLGDQVIIHKDNQMLPAIISSVSETSFDEMTVSVYTSKTGTVRQLRGRSLLTELPFSMNMKHSPVSSVPFSF